MGTARIDVSSSAFEAAAAAELENCRQQGVALGDAVGERAAMLARRYAPKGETLHLEDSIQFRRLARTGERAVGELTAGGPGAREAVPMEYGTWKDRPRPYMRPALAEASGGAFTARAWSRRRRPRA